MANPVQVNISWTASAGTTPVYTVQYRLTGGDPTWISNPLGSTTALVQALTVPPGQYDIRRQIVISGVTTFSSVVTMNIGESRNGKTVFTIPQIPVIINSFGEEYILSGAQVLLNGQPDLLAPPGILMYYDRTVTPGRVYVQSTTNQWFYKASSTDSWQGPASDPRTQAPPPPVGTVPVVEARFQNPPQQFIDSAGVTWGINLDAVAVANGVALNSGNSLTFGVVKLALANNGDTIWQQNYQGLWWSIPASLNPAAQTWASGLNPVPATKAVRAYDIQRTLGVNTRAFTTSVISDAPTAAAHVTAMQYCGFTMYRQYLVAPPLETTLAATLEGAGFRGSFIVPLDNDTTGSQTTYASRITTQLSRFSNRTSGFFGLESCQSPNIRGLSAAQVQAIDTAVGGALAGSTLAGLIPAISSSTGVAGSSAAPFMDTGTPATVVAGSGTDVALSALTTGGSGLIVCFVERNQGIVSSITDTAGLAWSLRAISPTTNFENKEEMWTAPASGALTNNVITIHFNPSAGFVTAVASCVRNANLAAPFANASAVTSGTDPASISTTVPSLIIGAARVGVSNPTSGAGWSQIFGNVTNSFMMVEYQSTSSAQTNLSFTVGNGAGTSNGVIVDAIVGSGSGTGQNVTAAEQYQTSVGDETGRGIDWGAWTTYITTNQCAQQPRTAANGVDHALTWGRVPAPARPVVSTEYAYCRPGGTDAERTTSASGPKMALNHICDDFYDGMAGSFIYQLFRTPSLSPDLGLFDTAGNPGLIATAIHNFTTIIGDAGVNAATFTTGALGATLGLPANSWAIIFQKVSGLFGAIVWNEPEVQTAPSNGTPVDIAPTPATVTCQATQNFSAVSRYDPCVAAGAAQNYGALATGNSINFTISGSPQILIFTP